MRRRPWNISAARHLIGNGIGNPCIEEAYRCKKLIATSKARNQPWQEARLSPAGYPCDERNCCQGVRGIRKRQRNAQHDAQVYGAFPVFTFRGVPVRTDEKPWLELSARTFHAPK